MATLNTTPEKLQALQTIEKLSPDTLKIISDLAKKPGIERKLREKIDLIKIYL
jgi:hypothetical protein